MKYTTYAKIIFPLGIVYFLIVFSRFCILSVQAHQWNGLIMGTSPTLALLAWFIGFYMTVNRQKPITQWDARAGMGFFLVISAIVLKLCDSLSRNRRRTIASSGSNSQTRT